MGEDCCETAATPERTRGARTNKACHDGAGALCASYPRVPGPWGEKAAAASTIASSKVPRVATMAVVAEAATKKVTITVTTGRDTSHKSAAEIFS